MSLFILAAALAAVAAVAVLPAVPAGIGQAGRPSEDRTTLVHEAVIPAPLADVWKSFTTGPGQESWNVAHATVDLKVGGVMRTHYRKEGRLGDEGTIENTILSYDPLRMISFRVTRFPRGFPFPTAVKTLWHVLYFEPVDATHTRVTLRGLGYTPDAESQKMRDFFRQGNASTLKQWSGHFTPSIAPRDDPPEGDGEAGEAVGTGGGLKK
jgi:uncharacterized protein YndB with AHSA1/START domain